MVVTYLKLTKPKMRALPHGQKISEHGIVYERLQTGHARFSINIMVRGRRIHRVVGYESEGIARKDAENFLYQKKADIKNGETTNKKTKFIPLAFDKVAKNYLERLEQSDGKDIKGKSGRIKNNLIPFFRKSRLDEIKAFDVDRFKNTRLKSGVTNGSVNNDLSTLSHIFSMAVEWEWIGHIPAKIKKLKENPSRKTYLSQEQVVLIVDIAKKDRCRHVHPFFMVGLGTGMRRMEILSIRVEHINFANGTIFVPEAKDGSRTQPMTPELTAYLKTFVQGCEEWLFPSLKSKSGHITAIEIPFRRVIENAGLDPNLYVRHTLRHTVITHLVQAGVDLPTVKRISGHKTLAMVEKYAHQNGDHIQVAIEKLQGKISANG